MGFHVCSRPTTGFIHGRRDPFFSHYSSGDNDMTFSSGNSWCFPDALIYYIVDCGYQPPEAFIRDVMESVLTGESRVQTRGIKTKGLKGGAIGYLDQDAVDRAAQTAWDGNVAGFGDFTRKFLTCCPGLDQCRRTGFPLEDVIAFVAEQKKSGGAPPQIALSPRP